MLRRSLLAGLGAAALPLAALPSTALAAPAGLDASLRPLLAQYNLPALAAAVTRGGRVIAAGAVGTRRAGTKIAVQVTDRFHIGSDTKAMTALLAAILVERGKLRWESTVAESFPDMTDGMDKGLAGVTLIQLLSHTSGIPSDNDAFTALLGRSFTQDGLNLDGLRAWLVREWRSQPLVARPGTTFAYSNLGYTMAGAMLERAGGASWEELVVANIFDPLRLRSAGFGPQASLGHVDAPLGHIIGPDGSLKPMLAGPNGDNPLIIGPAGTVHLSILDFAAWAAWNAAEGRHGTRLVSPAALRKLHAPIIDLPPRPGAAPGTPSAGSYAMGWGLVSVPWARERLLTHSGSNTMNLAMAWLQPSRDFALVVATNVGGAKADEALKALSETLYRRYAPAG